MLNLLKNFFKSKTVQKRLPAVLLCLLIAVGAGVSLFIYRQQTTPNQPVSSTVTQQDNGAEQTTDPLQPEQENSTETIQDSTPQQQDAQSNTSQEETPTTGGASNQGEASAPSGGSTAGGNNSGQTGTDTTDQQPAQPAQITVYVEVECKILLNHLGNMTPEKAALVPKDGVLLSKVAITLSPGQTAFDALQSACNNAGIRIDYGSGYYVRGIGGLYEKDCGPKSGWLYYVNGTLPNMSCGYYTLSQGDTLRFSYTV